MPYNNAYNQMIAKQVLDMYINRVNHDNACSDNTRTNDVMSPLEGMALMKEDVVGGNGTVAATLHDLGYEVTNGTHGESEVRPRRGKGLSAGGLSAGGVSAGPYAQWNVGDAVGDDPAHVAANRARVAQAMSAAELYRVGFSKTTPR